MKITHEFCPSDRYTYDFGVCSYSKGFAQVDTKQDAPYYGTWANPDKRIIFCYCEGDTTMTECATDKEFTEEMRSLAKWSIEGGYDFHIDTMCVDAMTQRFTALGLADLLW